MIVFLDGAVDNVSKRPITLEDVLYFCSGYTIIPRGDFKIEVFGAVGEDPKSYPVAVSHMKTVMIPCSSSPIEMRQSWVNAMETSNKIFCG